MRPKLDTALLQHGNEQTAWNDLKRTSLLTVRIWHCFYMHVHNILERSQHFTTSEKIHRLCASSVSMICRVNKIGLWYTHTFLSKNVDPRTAASILDPTDRYVFCVMISLCFASGFEKWHPTLAEGLHSPPVAPMIHQDATSAWSSRSWRDSPPDDCNSSRIRDSSSRKNLETSLYHRESRLNSKNLIRHTLRHISARARAFLARVRSSVVRVKTYPALWSSGFNLDQQNARHLCLTILVQLYALA